MKIEDVYVFKTVEMTILPTSYYVILDVYSDWAGNRMCVVFHPLGMVKIVEHDTIDFLAKVKS